MSRTVIETNFVLLGAVIAVVTTITSTLSSQSVADSVSRAVIRADKVLLGTVVPEETGVTSTDSG